MLYYVTSCYIMLYYATSCYIMLSCIVRFNIRNIDLFITVLKIFFSLIHLPLKIAVIRDIVVYMKFNLNLIRYR